VRRINTVTWVLGIWNGEGVGRIKEGEVSLQATWDQGGQILSQQGGFQVSKGGLRKRSKGESAKGEKARG
jgi:hypothetical protein